MADLPNRLWDDEDVAQMLGSTVAAVRAERAAAKREGREPNLPPCVRIGQRVRYVPNIARLWVLSRLEERGRALASV